MSGECKSVKTTVVDESLDGGDEKQVCLNSFINPKEQLDENNQLNWQYSQSFPNRIRIQIGKESCEYPIQLLKQLSYFNAMLSDRWTKNGKNSNKTDVINVFGGSKYDDSDNNNNGTPILFDCNDLRMLLLFIDFGYINPCLQLTYKQIDSLLYCSDYFGGDGIVVSNHQNNNSDGSGVTISDLIKYLQDCRPAINSETRKKWVINAKHPKLRESLIKYNKVLTEQISALKSRLIRTNATHDLVDTFNRLPMTPKYNYNNNIVYDSSTAALLFKKQLVCECEIGSEMSSDCHMYMREFNRSEWKHLKTMFDLNKYWHYFGYEISHIIRNLNNCERRHITSGSYDNCDEVYSLLLEIIELFVSGRINLDSLKNNSSEVTLATTIKAALNLKHYGSHRNRFVPPVLAEFQDKYCPLLSVESKQEISSMMLATYPLYLKEFKGDYNNDELMPNWWKFMKYLLSNSSGSYLVCNAKIWFPIMHKCEYLDINKSVEWVFENVVSKLNTQLSFNLGLYMAEYVSVVKDGNNVTLPSKYLEFIRNETGIDWAVLKQKINSERD